ncbi:MAG: ABC transporter substrate-binding protein [Desulfarculus sp.]|nr:ABC transporter substrate-binding protein [Desulfarculus sp.]
MAVLVGLLLTACGPADGDSGRSAFPRLAIGVGRDFYDGPDSRSYLHGSTNAWEALAYVDENLRPRPWLAQAWRAEDGGRTWVFQLRAGVRFHDGSPFTANDAAFCLRRIAASPKYDPSGSFRHLRAVEASGDLDLICRLDRPTPDFPALVAYYGSPMLKPETVDASGRITRLVATGPYRLEGVVPGHEVRLRAWEGYWGQPPAYARVVFRMLADAQTRVLALMAGDLDVVADVGAILPEQEPELRAAAGVKLMRQEVATTHYLVFNCRRPPFDQRTARLWLAGLIQEQGLVASLAGGIAVAARDPYSRLARDWASGLFRPPLAEGRVIAPGGEPLVILLHAGTVQRWPYLDLAQALQHGLRRRGLSARIVVSEAGAYQQALKQGDYDLSMQPNTLMTGDPDFFYSYYLAGEAPANPGWRDPETDRLIAAARTEMDPEQRRQAYASLAGIAARDLPLLPLFHETALYAHRQTVADFHIDHFFRPDLLRVRPRTGS